MRRPDLSVATIAGALALLGTSAVIASCAKSAPAENATTEPARTIAPASSASSADKGTTPIQASPVASVSAAVGDASTAGPGKADDTKKRVTTAPTGMASCGAGTCTADPKKKK